MCARFPSRLFISCSLTPALCYSLMRFGASRRASVNESLCLLTTLLSVNNNTVSVNITVPLNDITVFVNDITMSLTIPLWLL